MYCKRTGESEYDLPKTKNIITYEALVLALNFSRSRKLLGKFQDFFKNSRLCTDPGNCRDLPSFHVIIGWSGWSSVTMYLIRSNG